MTSTRADWLRAEIAILRARHADLELALTENTIARERLDGGEFDCAVVELQRLVAPEGAELDPGIRATVQRLWEAGFETSDSGDGVSKPGAWYESGEAIPFPHVVIATTPERMVVDAHRVADILGPDWNVEAEYQTLTGNAHLFARTLDPREEAARG